MTERKLIESPLPLKVLDSFEVGFLVTVLGVILSRQQDSNLVVQSLSWTSRFYVVDCTGHELIREV